MIGTIHKVCIFGVPRSGTTWLGQLFNSHPAVLYRHQPLFSYVFKDRLNEQSSHREIADFFDALSVTDDTYVLQKEVNKMFFFRKTEVSTHLVMKETRYLYIVENLLRQMPDIKIIGIVRNPLSVLSSWMQAPKEFKPEWNIFEEWRYAPRKNQNRSEEFFGYEKWKEAANLFLTYQASYPDNFYLVQYTDLNTNTLETIKTVFSFCKLDMHPQAGRFLEVSTQTEDNDPYSVLRYQNSDEKWKQFLESEIVEYIYADLRNTRLARFL